MGRRRGRRVVRGRNQWLQDFRRQRPAASPAMLGSPSPITTSTTSVLPGAQQGTRQRRSVFSPPTMPSRRRPCASSLGLRPTCTTASLATLEDVVRHYEKGGVAADAQQRSPLQSRADRWSATTSSRFWSRFRVRLRRCLRGKRGSAPASRRAPPPEDTTVVSQANKVFAPDCIRLPVGQALTVLNDDTRTHNVRIFDPRARLQFGAQEPKESVTIAFPFPAPSRPSAASTSMRLQFEVQ